ncbi:hypothetical protein ABPG73_006301 [Tetrahymena malaccensis]
MNTNTKNQAAIFYIQVDFQQKFNTINYSKLDVDLQSDYYLQLLVLNGQQYQFSMDKSQIINGSSMNFGGCLNFIQSFESNQQAIINISNSSFQKCKSKYLGGAISGIQQINVINSNFTQCNSQIGGALFTLQSELNFKNELFSQNTANLTANNFNKLPLKLDIAEILEINDQNNFNEKNLFKKADKFLYPGLTYIIKLQIEVDGEIFYSFNNNSYFGNLYDFLIQPSNSFIRITPPQLLSINFPFLIWYAYDLDFHGEQSIDFQQFEINFVKNYTLKTNQYSIKNGCKEQSMEKVYLNNQKQFVCNYCSYMKAGYNGVCQSCQTNYFSECYGDYSVLKQQYWRSEYSVDPSDILYCSNNPSSCQGGSGIGNELCYEGHIGAQCLNCDVNGEYWGENYSSEGFFQCVKCNSISFNTGKIILLIVFLGISLVFILVSTFKRLENQIFAIYLTKMGIFFLGKTIQQKTLTSTYIKIMLFHLQVFIISNQFTKVNLISFFFQFQFLFYSPLSSQLISLSCFISQYKPVAASIGFSDLLLTFMIPIIICSITILVSMMVFLWKKEKLKRILYANLLTFIYIFIITFSSILLEKTLSSFFCLNLDKNKSYSLIDLSLQCGNSTELQKIQNLSLVILIICLILFPVIIFMMLFQSRKRLQTVKVMFMFGFLYSEYKEKFFFWEMIRLLVKSLLCLLSISLKQYPQISLIMICLMLFSYFIALKSYNPFISAFLNNLEKISIIISIMILMSSVMYLLQSENENENIQHFRTAFYMNDIIFNISSKLSQQCCIFKDDLQELLEMLLKSGNVFENARYYENSKYSLTLRAQNIQQKKLCAILIVYFPFVDDLSTLNDNQLKGEIPSKFILSQIVFKKFLINEYKFDIFENISKNFRFQDLEQNQNSKIKHLKDAFKDYFELKYEFGNDVGNGIQQSISSCVNLVSLNISIQIKNNSYKLSMRGLCKGISQCTNLSTLILNLIFCGVDCEGAIQIGNTIGKCSNLQSFQLNLDGSQISQEGVVGLAEGISYSQNLFCLILSLNFCYIQGEELQILLQKIQICPLISQLELHLSENELNYEDLTDISSQFSQFSYLYSLTLSFNYLIMMPDAILKITNDISKCSNLQYLSLNLKNCEFNEDIAGMLGDGLSKCESLQSLNLNLLGNESIQTEGVLHLLDGIIKCKNINNLSINLINCFFSCLDQFIGKKIRKMSNLKQLQLLSDSLVQTQTMNHIRKTLRLVNFIRQ